MLLIGRNIRSTFFSKRNFSCIKPNQNGYNSNIPLISPLLNHRMLGKEHFDTNINEDTVLELLQSITKQPVLSSKYPYYNLKNLRTSNVLPKPDDLTSNLSQYITDITLKVYPREMKYKVDAIVTNILRTLPEKMSEEDYLNVLFYFHKSSNFNMQFETLEIMKAETNFRQTIDFDNILLSKSSRPTVYKYLIERLETLQDKGATANTNTWYYLFDIFENPEPKQQMLKLMNDLEIDIKPILSSLSPLLPFFTRDQLLELYRSAGYKGEISELPIPLFNQLAQIYIKQGELQDLWNLMESNPKLKKFFSPSLYVHIISHLLENGQVGFAFAFSNLFLHKLKFSKKLSKNILESMLLNNYLPTAKYFDNWLSLTRAIYPSFNKRDSIFLNDKTVSRLNDYCKIHKLENNFKTKSPKDMKLMKLIKNELVWKDGNPKLILSENTSKFIQAANAVNQFK